MKRTMSLMLVAYWFASTQVFAADSMEMSKLIKTFLRPANSNYALGWDTGAEPGSPITWQTNSVASGGMCGEGYPMCRTGSVVVTVDGKVTHKILEKNVRYGRWQVTMSGPHAGVFNVSISNDGSLGEEAINFARGVLEKSDIKYTLIKCPNEPPTDGNVVYQINAPGKSPAWLIDGWTCGASNCSSTISIVQSEEDIKNIECFGGM